MRIRMFGAMAALTLAICATVVLCSPYAPVVTPAPENIEEIWNIEDARRESETPLVTYLEMDGMPLAYDAQENTFYCTLGMGQGESWPQIHLTAPKAQGVRLTFVDDYRFDWCADAIRDGYAYQAMAYTDEAFSYFNIVFTGLAQIMIATDGREITSDADTPIHVRMAAAGETPLDTTARAHLRGASTLLFDKKSYKVEFTRERDGGAKKIEVHVPGFGAANDLALLPCVHDETKMRDRLNWDLWAEMAEDGEPFGARKTGHAEVFLDGAYMGLYLMVEPVDVKEELSLAGGSHLETDSVYRTAALNFSRDREYVRHPYRENAGYELYYAPDVSAGTQEKFAALAPYLELVQMQDDGQFAARAQEILDIDSLLRHSLFVQGTGLADNVFNNMYIWADRTDGGVKYRVSLWDMDLAWGFERASIGEEYENWMYFPVLDRLMNLDVGGIRQRAYDLWQQMRGTIFSEEKLDERIARYTSELGESGALMRDANRWGSAMTYPDGYELTTFAQMRWPLIDEAMQTLVSTDGPVDFLTRANYAQKGGPIVRSEYAQDGEDAYSEEEEYDEEAYAEE